MLVLLVLLVLGRLTAQMAPVLAVAVHAVAEAPPAGAFPPRSQWRKRASRRRCWWATAAARNSRHASRGCRRSSLASARLSLRPLRWPPLRRLLLLPLRLL